jgi:hypothetical protein
LVHRADECEDRRVTHDREPTGERDGAIHVAITNVATDVGNGDAVDLLISLYADVALSQGATTWTWEGVTILEVASHLTSWDQQTTLAVGSMTEEADPILTITVGEERATFLTADGACLVTSRPVMQAAITFFATEVDRLSRAHFARSLADIQEELGAEHKHPRRARRFGPRRR